MASHDNWESLVTDAQQRLAAQARVTLAPAVEKMLARHIQKDVYDAYEPQPDSWVVRDGSGRRTTWRLTTYQRRYVLFDHIFTDVSTGRGHVVDLFTSSRGKADKPIIPGWSFHNRRPGALLQLIEGDNHGIWRHGFARHPVTNTNKEIGEKLKSGALRTTVRGCVKTALEKTRR
jgi:hypothetical protein